jgi:hypothetical protein
MRNLGTWGTGCVEHHAQRHAARRGSIRSPSMNQVVSALEALTMYDRNDRFRGSGDVWERDPALGGGRCRRGDGGAWGGRRRRARWPLQSPALSLREESVLTGFEITPTAPLDERRQSGIGVDRLPLCRKSGCLEDLHPTAAPGAIQQSRTSANDRARLPLRNGSSHVAPNRPAVG